MAGKLLQLALKNRSIFNYPFGTAGQHCTSRSIIGNRDIVGYGVNGTPCYSDRADYPMPAIRWQETTPDIACLREKEKGDWIKLSIKDKKALYRSSFCQTFSEFEAATGEWKTIFGRVFLIVSFGLWLFYAYKIFVYSRTPLPNSFSEESQRAQLRRMIDIQINPITGLASEWNYDRNCWK